MRHNYQINELFKVHLLNKIGIFHFLNFMPVFFKFSVPNIPFITLYIFGTQTSYMKVPTSTMRFESLVSK